MTAWNCLAVLGLSKEFLFSLNDNSRGSQDHFKEVGSWSYFTQDLGFAALVVIEGVGAYI